MRPYLLLMAVVLMAAAAFGQQPIPYPGVCFYGCGPFVPRLTTPEISLQQFSPNPVGATNATTGLIAGATNSTLSQLEGSTSSVYTVAVWYRGGDAPLMTRDINLSPERIGREGHPIHEATRPAPPSEVRARAERAREVRPREERAREEHGPRHSEEARGDWTYFRAREHTSDAALAANEAKGFRKAAHVYNNEDVSRQNDKNGVVKYDGKTEKI
jgi:hypothetical protein